MTNATIQSVLGPRVPADEPPTRRWRYAVPTVLFIFAAAILIASVTQPYWNMTLYAPQYPQGLHVQAYLDRLEGDVREIDLLNHYIGMRPLEEAAQLERSLSLMLVIVLATLIAAAMVVHTRWAALLALPALLYPAGFLGDLWFWLHHFGQNLDPTAPLSTSIKPFTPPVLGEGMIGNFRTVAAVDVGWWMALTASLLVVAGLYFHRRAYKPLVDAACRGAQHSPWRATEGHGGENGLTNRHVDTSTRQQAGVRRQVSGVQDARTSKPLRERPRNCALHGPRWPSVVMLALLGMLTNAATAQTPFDLAGAIASAPEGSTIAVPAGVYEGPVIVDRPVTLDGGGRAVIDGRGQGDVVRITAPGVTLRGFTVRTSGISLNREHTGILALAPRAVIEDNVVEDTLFGISLKEAPDSVVRNNAVTGKDLHIARRGDGIRLWASHDTLIEGNRVHAVRDVVMWYSNNVRLTGNRVTGSRYGLHFMYSHDNVLEANVLEENSVGAFLMYSRNLIVRRNIFARNRGPSGYGLGVKDMQGMIVEDNVFVGNRAGVYLDNPPVYLPDYDRFTRNVFAYNDVGIAFQPSVRRVAVYENSFIENHQQVAVWGGGELRGNHFASRGEKPRGNYWSDYRGFDLTGDGIGDLPYRAEGLWDSLMDREPALRLFLFSPAQQAVDLAAKAFPMVRPRPLLTDEAPLMRPMRPDVPPQEKGGAGGTWALAVALLFVAGLALCAARPQAARGFNGGPS